MVDQHILMCYDVIEQGHVFECHRGRIFVKDQDDQRVLDVVGGLVDIAWRLPEIPTTEMFQKVFTRACTYSDQAWDDLTEIGVTVLL
jgi:hypothetical protein